MLRFRFLFPLVVAALLGGPALASLEVARTDVPEAALAGEAELRVFIWRVYEASLYAPGGVYDADAPFALSLSYGQSFTSEQIVNRSITEIERQPGADAAALPVWRDQLAGIIPDVEPGMTIVGVRDENGYAHFYLDGRRLGSVEDREFARRFFDIWLGESTSRPAFRQALLSDSET